MNRRLFLASLPALVAGTTSYFDMGPSWQKHGSLWLHDGVGIAIRLVREFDLVDTLEPDKWSVLLGWAGRAPAEMPIDLANKVGL